MQAQQNQKPQQVQMTSYDAPPLDFSFKNIKTIEQLRTMQPRQGQRKKVVQNQTNEDTKLSHKQEDELEQADGQKQQGSNADKEKQKKKVNQITRLLPQNNVNTVVTTMVNTSNMKNISSKAKQQLQKKKKKVISIKLVCCSLMLGYNKLRSLEGLGQVVSAVMENSHTLQWLDLSHNYLQHLTYDFSDFPHLKSLYLHCNFLYDINELSILNKREQMRTFTIHGNPLASVPNFRIYVISQIPNLKKLDSVLISKKERDNAKYLSAQLKKFPVPKNIQKAPLQKSEDDQDKQIVL